MAMILKQKWFFSLKNYSQQTATFKTMSRRNNIKYVHKHIFLFPHKKKKKSINKVFRYIVGTLGCVFIDNETHESGVTKCMTGEAWSAFSWHHSSVFHCQWTHNQVFLLLSHMLIQNAKSILIYVMKYVSGLIPTPWQQHMASVRAP